MEFGADLLAFNLIVAPYGAAFRGVTPDGENGLAWDTVHGFAAAIPCDMPAAMEGINEAGLQAGDRSSSSTSMAI
jgi:penicillin V acylase-like amidase (Ntn superfamily)